MRDMPQHRQWDPGFDVRHEDIDAQHRGLPTLCERLAGHCLQGGGAAHEQRFDADFEALKALVRGHLENETTLLSALGDPDAEDHRVEHEEFDDLAGEIITTGTFDRLELQRFVALWCLGHITASAAQLRARLPRG